MPREPARVPATILGFSGVWEGIRQSIRRSTSTEAALANIKNPPVIYARQANIANGPQQVNNGVLAPSHVRENETEQSKLSGAGYELLEDTRTPTLASGADPALEAVGEVHRAEDGRR